MVNELLEHPLNHASIELATAVRAAAAASDVLTSGFETGVSVSNKFSEGLAQGLVTQADVDAERVIVEIIRDALPGHSILAEESLTDTPEADHLWIIDPLDGTNNFANRIPHFAVSIAYYDRGVPKIGVVVDPMRNDWFIAVAGQGAWHNQRLAGVHQVAGLDQAIVAVGFYYDRGEMMRGTLRSIEQLFTRGIQGLRRMGTASLDLVQVGLGRFGGYFEYELSPWDFAAARLFVEEAGGQVTDCSGNPLQLKKTSVLASNGVLHESLLETVSRNVPPAASRA